MVYSNTAVYSENEYGKSCRLSFFHFLTDSMTCRATQLRFF